MRNHRHFHPPPLIRHATLPLSDGSDLPTLFLSLLMVRPGELVPRGWLSLPSPPLLRAHLRSPPRSATPRPSTVGLWSQSIDKVVVPTGTALWYCTVSFVLCWYGRTLRNIVTPLPSAFLALLLSVTPRPSPSPTFGSAGTLLLVARRPHPASVSLLMSSD